MWMFAELCVCFNLQRRFVFALVWYSVSERLEVTYMCNEST